MATAATPTAPPDPLESNNLLVRIRLRGTSPILFNYFTERAKKSLDEKGKKSKPLSPEQAAFECRERLHYDPTVELPEGVQNAFELHGQPNCPNIGIPFSWLWGTLKGATKGEKVGTSKANYSKADGSTVLGAHVTLLDKFWAFDPTHQKWIVDKVIGNNKNAGGGKGAAMPVYRAKIGPGWEIVIFARISTHANDEATFRRFFSNAGCAIGMGSARVGNGGAFGSFKVDSWRGVRLPEEMTDIDQINSVAKEQVDWDRVTEQIVRRVFTADDLPGIPLLDGVRTTSSHHSAMSAIELPTRLNAVKEAIKADYASDNPGKTLKSVFTGRLNAALDDRFGPGQWEIDGKTVRVPVKASAETDTDDLAGPGPVPSNGVGTPDHTAGTPTPA